MVSEVREAMIRRAKRCPGRLGRVVLCAVVALGLLADGQAAAAGPATEAVRTTINAAIAVLEDKELQQPERKDARRQKLIEIIGGRFDYEEMAKRTIGAEWRRINEAERKEFVDLFTSLLVQSYAGRIEGYSGEQIDYINERTEGDYAEVRTRVISGKAEIPLYYRMIHRSGGWRVYDVVVDGVSLVRNYRGQFSKILGSSSFAGLLGKLRDKVEQDDQDSAP